MQFYLAKNKEKLGPLTPYRVREMLSGGECGPEDLGWHQGLDKWMPLEEIPEIAFIIDELERQATEEAVATPPVVAPGDPAATPRRSASGGPFWKQFLPNPVVEEYGCRQLRPFARFAARSLDFGLWFVLVWALLGGYEVPVQPGADEDIGPYLMAAGRILAIDLGIVISWIAVEAWFISRYGATLGKYLLCIQVLNADGSLLDFSSSLRRSVRVTVFGTAFGFPIIREICMALGLVRLLTDGITLWDRALHLKVVHRPIGNLRIVIALLIFISIGMTMNSIVTPPDVIP